MGLIPRASEILSSSRYSLASKAYILQVPLWECVYQNGTAINEAAGVDWTRIPSEGRKEIRLYCPNRQVIVAGGGLPFRFNRSIMFAGYGTMICFYVVGIVTDANYACRFQAWDARQKSVIGPFFDNLLNMQFDQIGKMGLEQLGVA